MGAHVCYLMIEPDPIFTGHVGHDLDLCPGHQGRLCA